MDGIYPGLPKKMHRPIADGIVTGIKKDMAPSIRPVVMPAKPSATQNSVGVFGAGRTPEGDGDGKPGKGMKMAHSADGAVKRRREMVKEAHEALHNM